MRAAIPDVGHLLAVDYQELGNLKPQIYYRVPDQPPASYDAPWYGGRDYSWNFAGDCPNSQVPVTYNDYGEELCFDEGEMIESLIENLRSFYCNPHTGQNCHVSDFEVVGEYDTPYNVLYGSRFSSYNSKKVEFFEDSAGNAYLRTFSLFKEQPFTCPAGMHPIGRTSDISYYPNVCRSLIRSSISKHEFKQVRTCPANANPCHPATGDKSRAEADFTFGGRVFTRFYHSMREVGFLESSLAPGWTHSFAARLYPYSGMMLSPEGYKHDIRWLSGSTIVVPGLGNALIEQDAASGDWLLGAADGEVWRFNSQGRLLAMTNARNPARDIRFLHQQMPATRFVSSRYLLVQAVDSTGRILQFHHDEHYRLAGVTLPDGHLLTYDYDAQGNLAAVNYGNNQTKQYHYGETELAANGDSGLLTGITSEDGQRYASFGYDLYGRVTSSVLHGAEGLVDTTFIRYTAANVAEVDTAAGDVRHYTYSSSPDRSPVSITDASGTITKAYDHYARLTSQADANGTQKLYSYTNGRLTQIIEAANATDGTKRTTQTDWHATHNAPIERRTLDATNTLFAKTTWTYNTRGQVLTTTQTDPATNATRITTNTWCEQPDVDVSTCPRVGLLLSVDGPRTDVADIATYEYRLADAAGCDTSPVTCAYRKGDLWKTTNALGHVAEIAAYDGAGRVLESIDPNGVVTQYTYHPRGWLASRTVKGAVPTGDAVTTFAYDATGQIARITSPDGEYLDYEYDDAHRLVAIENAAGERIDYTLDTAGNRTAEATKDASAAITRQLSRTYDLLNRLIEQRDAHNQPTGFDYDANGNQTETEDALGIQTEQTHDPLNRLKQTLQDVGGLDVQTQFAYDPLDRLTKVTDPKGLDTEYDYDGLGNLVQLTSPDTGITTYTYDAAGNRITQTDARGITATYTHDALNRLTTIAYPDSSLNVAYHYDEASGTTGCAASFPQGRLTRMLDASGTTAYCYDRRGNVTQKRLAADGTTRTIGHAYTLGNRIKAITYPDGTIIDYTRNLLGQIIGVAQGGGGRIQPIITSATYRPFGPLQHITFDGGASQTFTHDGNDWVTAITGTALNLAYTHDARGNIDAITEAAQTRHYGYDALSRFTESSYPPEEPDPSGPIGMGLTLPLEHYTYDATGNRLSKEQNLPLATPYFQFYGYPTDSHRLASIGSQSRSYDAMGNLAAEGNRTFVHGDDQRLKQFQANSQTEATYAHNGKGERTRKTLAGTATQIDFIYDEQGRLLAEYRKIGTNPATLHRLYVWLDDRPVALQAKDGSYANQWLRIHTDHLGTPRAITRPNPSHTTVWRWALNQTAFGEHAPDENPDGDFATFTFNLRYPGQYFDQESGLHYNYFRDYDPSTGRYIESDPIGLRGGVNTYGYVSGRPLVSVDPRGLVQWDGTVESAGVAAVFGASIYRFKLKSQCVNGKQGQATVIAVGPTIGVEVSGTVPISGLVAPTTFHDKLSEVNPAVFNGQFVTWGASVALSLGYGCSVTVLGGSASMFGFEAGAQSIGCGIQAGVDATLATTRGTATVVESSISDCCDNE